MSQFLKVSWTSAWRDGGVTWEAGVQESWKSEPRDAARALWKFGRAAGWVLRARWRLKLRRHGKSAGGISPPAALRTVRETLASHGSHQVNEPVCYNGSSVVIPNSSRFRLVRDRDHLIRSLRSSPITRPSSPLRSGPPQTSASILSPHGFRPLGLLSWHPRPGSRSSA